MDSSTSSPEILRDASAQEESLEENCCLELMKSAEPVNLEVENPKKRRDTPWPSRTESKVKPSSGSILGAECQRNVEFLTPKQLDFSLLASPSLSMVQSDVSLDLTNPQSCTRDVPPNTPNLSNLEEELIKKAQQQEYNLKEHLKKLAPHSDLQRLPKKTLDFWLDSSPSLTSAENKELPNTPSLANLEDLAEEISPWARWVALGSPSSGYPTSSTSSLGGCPTTSMSEIDKTPNSSIIDGLKKEKLKEVVQNPDEEKTENIQKIVKGTIRTAIDPYPRNPSVYIKERRNQKEQNKGLEALKRLVPGLEPNSGEIEVCEMAVKYIKFLKSQVGSEVEKDFTS